MSNAFFCGKREEVFRPLTHADRECCAAVLRSLYDRAQGPNADYSEALTRELALKTMSRYGLVELQREKTHVRPVVKATGFRILAAA